MPKKNYRLYKVTLTSNIDKGQIKATYFPKLETSQPHERDYYVNTFLSGIELVMKQLLGDLPVLRPATDEERALEVYVFKDSEKDNNLYQARKAIYQAVANVFQNVLSGMFPDVEYVDTCASAQQEIAFNMSESEIEEHKYELEELSKKIRETKEGE